MLCNGQPSTALETIVNIVSSIDDTAKCVVSSLRRESSRCMFDERQCSRTRRYLAIEKRDIIFCRESAQHSYVVCRTYAERDLAIGGTICLFVCLSVRLSQAGIIWKQMTLGSGSRGFQRCRLVAQGI